MESLHHQPPSRQSNYNKNKGNNNRRSNNNNNNNNSKGLSTYTVVDKEGGSTTTSDLIEFLKQVENGTDSSLVQTDIQELKNTVRQKYASDFDETPASRSHFNAPTSKSKLSQQKRKMIRKGRTEVSGNLLSLPNIRTTPNHDNNCYRNGIEVEEALSQREREEREERIRIEKKKQLEGLRLLANDIMETDVQDLYSVLHHTAQHASGFAGQDRQVVSAGATKRKEMTMTSGIINSNLECAAAGSENGSGAEAGASLQSRYENRDYHLKSRSGKIITLSPSNVTDRYSVSNYGSNVKNQSAQLRVGTKMDEVSNIMSPSNEMTQENLESIEGDEEKERKEREKMERQAMMKLNELNRTIKDIVASGHGNKSLTQCQSQSQSHLKVNPTSQSLLPSVISRKENTNYHAITSSSIIEQGQEAEQDQKGIQSEKAPIKRKIQPRAQSQLQQQVQKQVRQQQQQPQLQGLAHTHSSLKEELNDASIDDDDIDDGGSDASRLYDATEEEQSSEFERLATSSRPQSRQVQSQGGDNDNNIGTVDSFSLQNILPVAFSETGPLPYVENDKENGMNVKEVEDDKWDNSVMNRDFNRKGGVSDDSTNAPQGAVIDIKTQRMKSTVNNQNLNNIKALPPLEGGHLNTKTNLLLQSQSSQRTYQELAESKNTLRMTKREEDDGNGVNGTTTFNIGGGKSIKARKSQSQSQNFQEQTNFEITTKTMDDKSNTNFMSTMKTNPAKKQSKEWTIDTQISLLHEMEQTLQAELSDVEKLNLKLITHVDNEKGEQELREKRREVELEKKRIAKEEKDKLMAEQARAMMLQCVMLVKRLMERKMRILCGYGIRAWKRHTKIKIHEERVWNATKIQRCWIQKLSRSILKAAKRRKLAIEQEENKRTQRLLKIVEAAVMKIQKTWKGYHYGKLVRLRRIKELKAQRLLFKMWRSYKFCEDIARLIQLRKRQGREAIVIQKYYRRYICMKKLPAKFIHARHLKISQRYISYPHLVKNNFEMVGAAVRIQHWFYYQPWKLRRAILNVVEERKRRAVVLQKMARGFLTRRRRDRLRWNRSLLSVLNMHIHLGLYIKDHQYLLQLAAIERKKIFEKKMEELRRRAALLKLEAEEAEKQRILQEIEEQERAAEQERLRIQAEKDEQEALLKEAAALALKNQMQSMFGQMTANDKYDEDGNLIEKVTDGDDSTKSSMDVQKLGLLGRLTFIRQLQMTIPSFGKENGNSENELGLSESEKKKTTEEEKKRKEAEAKKKELEKKKRKGPFKARKFNRFEMTLRQTISKKSVEAILEENRQEASILIQKLFRTKLAKRRLDEKRQEQINRTLNTICYLQGWVRTAKKRKIRRREQNARALISQKLYDVLQYRKYKVSVISLIQARMRSIISRKRTLKYKERAEKLAYACQPLIRGAWTRMKSKEQMKIVRSKVESHIAGKAWHKIVIDKEQKRQILNCNLVPDGLAEFELQRMFLYFCSPTETILAPLATPPKDGYTIDAQRFLKFCTATSSVGKGFTARQAESIFENVLLDAYYEREEVKLKSKGNKAPKDAPKSPNVQAQKLGRDPRIKKPHVRDITFCDYPTFIKIFNKMASIRFSKIESYGYKKYLGDDARSLKFCLDVVFKSTLAKSTFGRIPESLKYKKRAQKKILDDTKTIQRYGRGFLVRDRNRKRKAAAEVARIAKEIWDAASCITGFWKMIKTQRMIQIRAAQVYQKVINRQSKPKPTQYYFNPRTGSALWVKPRLLRHNDVRNPVVTPELDRDFTIECDACHDYVAKKWCLECEEYYCLLCDEKLHKRGKAKQHNRFAMDICCHCENQISTRGCLKCGDEFCDTCFHELHKRGQMLLHPVNILTPMCMECKGPKYCARMVYTNPDTGKETLLCNRCANSVEGGHFFHEKTKFHYRPVSVQKYDDKVEAERQATANQRAYEERQAYLKWRATENGATNIQRVWRGYWARKPLRKLMGKAVSSQQVALDNLTRRNSLYKFLLIFGLAPALLSDKPMDIILKKYPYWYYPLVKDAVNGQWVDALKLTKEQANFRYKNPRPFYPEFFIGEKISLLFLLIDEARIYVEKNNAEHIVKTDTKRVVNIKSKQLKEEIRKRIKVAKKNLERLEKEYKKVHKQRLKVQDKPSKRRGPDGLNRKIDFLRKYGRKMPFTVEARQGYPILRSDHPDMAKIKIGDTFRLGDDPKKSEVYTIKKSKTRRMGKSTDPNVKLMYVMALDRDVSLESNEEMAWHWVPKPLFYEDPYVGMKYMLYKSPLVQVPIQVVIVLFHSIGEQLLALSNTYEEDSDQQINLKWWAEHLFMVETTLMRYRFKYIKFKKAYAITDMLKDFKAFLTSQFDFIKEIYNDMYEDYAPKDPYTQWESSTDKKVVQVQWKVIPTDTDPDIKEETEDWGTVTVDLDATLPIIREKMRRQKMAKLNGKNGEGFIFLSPEGHSLPKYYEEKKRGTDFTSGRVNAESGEVDYIILLTPDITAEFKEVPFIPEPLIETEEEKKKRRAARYKRDSDDSSDPSQFSNEKEEGEGEADGGGDKAESKKGKEKDKKKDKKDKEKKDKKDKKKDKGKKDKKKK